MITRQIIVQFLLSHQARLVSYGWAIVGDEHVAEDLLQQAAMAAIEKADQIESPEHLDRWLRQAIRFHAMNWMREQRRHPVVFNPEIVDLVDQAWDRARSLDMRDFSETLHQCIAELTDHNRRIIELRYMKGRSGIEIAREIDRDVKAVYRALSRSHKLLAECVRRRMAKGGGHAW